MFVFRLEGSEVIIEVESEISQAGFLWENTAQMMTHDNRNIALSVINSIFLGKIKINITRASKGCEDLSA